MYQVTTQAHTHTPSLLQTTQRSLIIMSETNHREANHDHRWVEEDYYDDLEDEVDTTLSTLFPVKVQSKLYNCCKNKDCQVPTFMVDTKDPASYQPCREYIKKIMQWWLNHKLYDVEFPCLTKDDSCRYYTMRRINDFLQSEYLPWFLQSAELLNPWNRVDNFTQIWIDAFGPILYDVNFYGAICKRLVKIYTEFDANLAKKEYNRSLPQVLSRIQELQSLDYRSMYPDGLIPFEENVVYNHPIFAPNHEDYDHEKNTFAESIKSGVQWDVQKYHKCQDAIASLINKHVKQIMMAQRDHSNQNVLQEEPLTDQLTPFEVSVIESTLAAIYKNEPPWYMKQKDHPNSCNHERDNEKFNVKWISFLPRLDPKLAKAIICWLHQIKDEEFINLLYELPTTCMNHGLANTHESCPDFLGMTDIRQSLNMLHFNAFCKKFELHNGSGMEISRDVLCVIGGCTFDVPWTVISNAWPKKQNQ